MTVAALDKKRLPRHVAIIMDGNGRWAKQHKVSRLKGHDAGAKSVRVIVEACRELETIESLTLYAFSTENWRRSKVEVSALFRLLTKYISLELDNLDREGIRVTFMGRRDGIADKVLANMDRATERTRDNTSLLLNLAVNYGARSELTDACRKIAQDVQSGMLSADSIDETTLAENLYIPEVRDVDLLIRTSGELRLSNFMLWQLSYAEIVTTPTFWPDFRKPNFYAALTEYQSRHRRYGKRR